MVESDIYYTADVVSHLVIIAVTCFVLTPSAVGQRKNCYLAPDACNPIVVSEVDRCWRLDIENVLVWQ